MTINGQESLPVENPAAGAALSDGQAEAPAAGNVVEMAVVRCCGALYGFEVRWVREIRPYGGATPADGLPAHWLGIAALRGQLYAILDLPQLLCGQGLGTGERRQVVFTAVGDLGVGLLVEEILTVCQVDVETIMPVATVGAPYVLGLTAEQVTVLDLPALFADPRLTDAAGEASETEQ